MRAGATPGKEGNLCIYIYFWKAYNIGFLPTFGTMALVNHRMARTVLTLENRRLSALTNVKPANVLARSALSLAYSIYVPPDFEIAAFTYFHNGLCVFLFKVLGEHRAALDRSLNEKV